VEAVRALPPFLHAGTHARQKLLIGFPQRPCAPRRAARCRRPAGRWGLPDRSSQRRRRLARAPFHPRRSARTAGFSAGSSVRTSSSSIDLRGVNSTGHGDDTHRRSEPHRIQSGLVSQRSRVVHRGAALLGVAHPEATRAMPWTRPAKPMSRWRPIRWGGNGAAADSPAATDAL